MPDYIRRQANGVPIKIEEALARNVNIARFRHCHLVIIYCSISLAPAYKLWYEANRIAAALILQARSWLAGRY